ncbi:TetR/AcrR family transcriptional regulator [Flavobacterium sp. 102]|uniref:TetR/AcrR family transcriptional regulator n=1 Tax=Flavobacterium sp. 102 TaxID=2135623 RepID=UPI000F29C0B6|nr:TetR/AcrR family transcriptional regulator [Flavobacterium sp. 102]RKS03191.1 TetR family transcriptional regulator [Flavobacterium sp. 102]
MISKADRTKQFIIEKIAPIFNCKGYACTSLNDMIVATGLTKGSIYGNFESKDEVALAVFDYNFQLVVTHIRSKMETRNSIVEKLLVYPETYRNYLQLPFLQHGCPVMNTAIEADGTHPQLKAKAANAIQFWRSSMERQLNEGMASGEIKSDSNTNEICTVIISLIQGGVMQTKVTGNTIALNSGMDYLVRFIQNLKG